MVRECYRLFKTREHHATVEGGRNGSGVTPRPKEDGPGLEDGRSVKDSR